jgi:hypothetical protein
MLSPSLKKLRSPIAPGNGQLVKTNQQLQADQATPPFKHISLFGKYHEFTLRITLSISVGYKHLLIKDYFHSTPIGDLGFFLHDISHYISPPREHSHGIPAQGCVAR